MKKGIVSILLCFSMVALIGCGNSSKISDEQIESSLEELDKKTDEEIERVVEQAEKELNDDSSDVDLSDEKLDISSQKTDETKEVETEEPETEDESEALSLKDGTYVTCISQEEWTSSFWAQYEYAYPTMHSAKITGNEIKIDGYIQLMDNGLEGNPIDVRNVTLTLADGYEYGYWVDEYWNKQSVKDFNDYFSSDDEYGVGEWNMGLSIKIENGQVVKMWAWGS